MKSEPFDVVVVSDFSEEKVRRFEIMTLYFLASWLEYAGRSRELPLHIVCIGEPPKSVRYLGAKCNAFITSHSPLLCGGFANKLRGFDVDRQTDHMLLLDSDMFVLSEIQNLSRVLGTDCVSAAPANGPCIIPLKTWERYHEMLNIPFKRQNVVPLNRELDTFQCVSYRSRSFFPAFYNGGIVYTPWKAGLGEIWMEHMEKITSIGKGKARRSNQPPLATSIAYLQSNGYKFRLLPPEYHVRWQHIAAGSVKSKNAKLLHAIGFGRWSAKGNSNSALDEINIYLSNTLKSDPKDAFPSRVNRPWPTSSDIGQKAE